MFLFAACTHRESELAKQASERDEKQGIIAPIKRLHAAKSTIIALIIPQTTIGLIENWRNCT